MTRWIAPLLVLAGPLLAQPAASPAARAFAPLAAASFDEVRRGVEALAASGKPRVAPVPDALQAGRLLVRPGGALFIRAPDGTVSDALGGEPAPEVAASALRPVRVNNAVARGPSRCWKSTPTTRRSWSASPGTSATGTCPCSFWARASASAPTT